MTTRNQVACCRCGEVIFIRPEHHDAVKASSQTFYCLWGHGNHYPQGETPEEKLRRERDRLKQETARLTDVADEAQRQREAAERRASAARGQVTKLKRSASAGVCPCCSHGFPNLKRHIEAKHPAFVTEAVEE